VRSPYSIRKVDGTDDEIADEIRWLHDQCFGSSAPHIDPEEGQWWLAYHGKEPVGFAGMLPSARYTDAGYLSRSGVLPEHRGHGLQVRLLRARERQAKKNGWVVLRTDTTHNPPSANSLIRAGYKTFTPEYPWGFDTTIYWRKELV
jgi:GNAT superfamily N-acetyltransferase